MLDDRDLEIWAKYGFVAGLAAWICSLPLMGFGTFLYAMHGPESPLGVGRLLNIAAHLTFLFGAAASLALWHRTGKATIWVWWNGGAVLLLAILMVLS